MESIVRRAESGSAFKVRVVLSNRPDAAGLAWAAARGIETAVVDHRQFESREEFDAALADKLNAYEPDLVVLAGFMRILTPGFVHKFQGRMVNIHPSLLPAFPGLNTHQQALNAGVRVHGATVHLVTAELDHGPILDQAVVKVEEGDTAKTLSDRVLALEHQIYPKAIEDFLLGRISAEQGMVTGAKARPVMHSLETSTQS